jgi:amino acid transporter
MRTFEQWGGLPLTSASREGKLGTVSTLSIGIGEQDRDFWLHLLISAVIVGLVVVNVFGTNLVVRSEDVFNAVKMLLLASFVVGGFLTSMDWSRLGPENFVTPLALVAGAMLIFLNYEGFELIANASRDIADPKRSLPIAYIGGVLYCHRHLCTDRGGRGRTPGLHRDIQV